MVQKILVVDDDASIRMLVSRFLAKRNFAVETAEDGVEAMERLDHGGYDAVVLDLMMPRASGFDVLAHMDQHQPEMRAHTLVVTAFPRKALSELGGSCALLSKPFELDDLLTAVQKCANEPIPIGTVH